MELFIVEPGFDGTDEWQPPGWSYKVEKDDRDQPQGEDAGPPMGYPLGVGNVMMSGCFGSGYKEGDPCYDTLWMTEKCIDQLDSANFIGVGYDITKTYSAESR